MRFCLTRPAGTSPDLLDANRFLFESRHVRVKREFADYADECFPEGVPILIGAKHLMNRIFNEFTFDPEATTVSTPVTEVFEKRRGVCQDFAHFMLSCLRSIGLAARYMSGYLLTRPPEGKPRLIGADATHAWIAVYTVLNRAGWFRSDQQRDARPAAHHPGLGPRFRRYLRCAACCWRRQPTPRSRSQWYPKVNSMRSMPRSKMRQTGFGLAPTADEH